MKIDINLLKEHPSNLEIYGADEEEQFNILVNRLKNPVGFTGFGSIKREQFCPAIGGTGQLFNWDTMQLNTKK